MLASEISTCIHQEAPRLSAWVLTLALPTVGRSSAVKLAESRPRTELARLSQAAWRRSCITEQQAHRPPCLSPSSARLSFSFILVLSSPLFLAITGPPLLHPPPPLPPLPFPAPLLFILLEHLRLSTSILTLHSLSAGPAQGSSPHRAAGTECARIEYSPCLHFMLSTHPDHLSPALGSTSGEMFAPGWTTPRHDPL